MTFVLKPKAGIAACVILFALVLLLGLAVTAGWGHQLDATIGTAIGEDFTVGERAGVG